MADTYQAPERGWTCFHCGETFHVYKQALEHFGHTPESAPACQLTRQTKYLLRALRIAESHVESLTQELMEHHARREIENESAAG